MSSTINPAGATAGDPQGNGQTQPQIIHFDATVRRKEKMRQKATGVQPAAAPALNGHVAPAVQPAAVQPAAFHPAPVQPVAAPQPVTPAPIAAAPIVAAPSSQPVPVAQPAAVVPNAAAAPTANAPAAVDNSHKKKLSVEELEKFLIDFVVEQTGYPAEMVELDADLEADLGIDSIKKAQMFGEIAEQVVLDVEIQLSADMSLDDFPTLRSIVEFITTPKPAAAPSAPAAVAPVSVAPAAVAPAVPVAPAPVAVRPVMPTPVQPAAPVPVAPQPIRAAAPVSAPVAPAPIAQPVTSASLSSSSSNTATATSTVQKKKLSPTELEQFLIDFVVEQTGYPAEMVELDADLEADLGIDSIKKAQMFGEIAEQVELDVEIELSADMSLDDFPTLRSIIQFVSKT